MLTTNLNATLDDDLIETYWDVKDKVVYNF